jgi:predicted nucleotidyltransferase
LKTVGTPFVLKCSPNSHLTAKSISSYSSNRDFFGFNRDSDSDADINRDSDVEIILPSPAVQNIIDKQLFEHFKRSPFG